MQVVLPVMSDTKTETSMERCIGVVKKKNHTLQGSNCEHGLVEWE